MLATLHLMNAPHPSPVLAHVLRRAALVVALGLSLLPAHAQVQPSRRFQPGGLTPPPLKDLIYVCLPGTLEGAWDQNGNGIVVLDASNNYAFLKRIPTWDVP